MPPNSSVMVLLEPVSGRPSGGASGATGARGGPTTAGMVGTSGLTPPVVGDAKLLTRSINELIDNAVKFTEEGGTVDILGSLHNGERLCLQIRDTGIGIKPEDFGKLFVEFQQLDSSMARRYQGTGLGLVLTKKIVEFQQGAISVQSEVGKGSTFTVVLPRVSQKVTQ